MSSYLILYAYYAGKQEDIEHRQLIQTNLGFFMKNAQLNNDNVELVIIEHVDNMEEASTLGDLSSYPVKHPIRVLRKLNQGYDFGAWSYAICDELKTEGWEKYQYFIFLNTSVRGPFLPRWMHPKSPKWYEMFCSHLNAKIRLVGPTVNYYHHPHIQSMIWATDLEGIKLFVNKGILKSGLDVKDIWPTLVFEHEIGLSKALMEEKQDFYGFQLSEWTFGSKHHEVHKGLHPLPHTDICHPHLYFGSTLNPFETMFIKAKWINTDEVKQYTSQMTSKSLSRENPH